MYPIMRDHFMEIDEDDLARVSGGADDPLGQTVLVAGRPQTAN